jgi:hypothetical protein
MRVISAVSALRPMIARFRRSPGISTTIRSCPAGRHPHEHDHDPTNAW